MNYILSATELNVCRRCCALLLSDEEETSDLHLLVAETLFVKEGLFPISEAKIVNHQLLVDLPRHIPFCGPLRNLWAFPGEPPVNYLAY
jgi:hypothetical protein